MLEIGHHLQHRHRGQGYALETARSCVDFALMTLEHPNVRSIVDPRNQSSIRVATAVHASRRTFVNDKGNERVLFWTDSSSATDGS